MAHDPIFGTDGIRGPVGQGWLTPAAAFHVGHAAGSVLGTPGAEALLAHDGRASGEWLVGALADGLRAAGLVPHNAGLLPTPGLAWLTSRTDAALGLMVSASHNPASDNGIKLFGKSGDKPTDPRQQEIEALLHQAAEGPSEAAAPPAVGTQHAQRYEDHLISSFQEAMAGCRTRIVLDCANGAGSEVGPRVLARLGLDAEALCASPDGTNINRACGSTHPEALQEAVRRAPGSIGIALDGDGDRCILVDESGNLVDGDGILTVLGRAWAGTSHLPGNRLAATVMSNRGLHIALEETGVRVVETAVGDRAVVEAMRAEGLELGGEQSGHVILGKDTSYIGDGLRTALTVLGVVAASGETLQQLAGPYRRLPQVLINVQVREKPAWTELPEVQERVREVEAALGSHGRVLLRYSGTEPLARVMVEGEQLEEIERLATLIVEAVQAAIGAST